MSSENRKIGFYNFIFQKYGIEEEKYFDKDMFKNLLDYVFSLPEVDKIIRIEKYKKAISIDSATTDIVTGGYLIKVIFKSCKYNHNPEYMSSVDGSERASDKRNEEGEKEKTHLCIKINNLEAKVILEERRSGVAITSITDYLNNKLREYLLQQGITRNFKLVYGIIPMRDFLVELADLNKIKIAEVFTHKQMLGSDGQNLIEREDTAMKSEIVITAKAKPKESLAKRTIKGLYDSITAEDGKVSRVRIYGSDGEGNAVKLDSLIIKKLEYVIADLDANGTVNTSSIFTGMMDILEADRE